MREEDYSAESSGLVSPFALHGVGCLFCFAVLGAEALAWRTPGSLRCAAFTWLLYESSLAAGRMRSSDDLD